jgi:IclR family acetate operon transcriptional repressor
MASKLGDPLQLHCTAIGKAILANLPAERRDELLQGHSLPRRTENTITSHSKLKAELRDVRRQGFAHDDEENEVNVRCVGAPVFDAHADVIGAISISAPTFELSKEAALALAPAVMEAGRSVSLALGAPEDALPAAYRRQPEREP